MGQSAQNSDKRRRGLVYTFYSYKGGVGRSMALANVAAYLAKLGNSVLIVDWDLEAPGIQRFFEQRPSLLSRSRSNKPGIVDLITALKDGNDLDWRKCLLEARPFRNTPIAIITAGQKVGGYVQSVQNFNWEELFSKHDLGHYLERLRDEWASEYDFVLIDSRTGINDIGGICTILLPDILVLLFTTSYQSIEGTAEVIQRVKAAQEKLPVERMRLFAVPVLARDESDKEHEQSKTWRNIIARALGEHYSDWLPPKTNPLDVLNKLYIPNIAYWSFGERLPVVEDAGSIGDPRSIVAAYARLGKLLASHLDWTKVSGRPTDLGDERAPVIHNLPFPPNPVFTGRDMELQKLRELLQNRDDLVVTQIVVIHGLEGVGKTQLAAEYAWKYFGDYSAVLWLKADSPDALDDGLATLASLLRLPEAGERRRAAQTKAVLGWLREHERWLLIADNVDTDAASRAVLDRLPPNLPGAVLITSRLSRWAVNIQDLPVDLLSADAAARFLLARVAKEGCNAGGEAAAKSLAQELGNLPLALEQAAATIVERLWSFDKYRERLRDARLELLSEHREGGTRYPKSIAETWRVMVEELSPPARVLLQIASWFASDAIPRGVFSSDLSVLSEALGGDMNPSVNTIDKALGELDRLSLIRTSGEAFSVHRLLQAVEQDSLCEDDRRRCLMWACRLFDTFAPKPPDDVSTWNVWVLLGPHAETLIEHTHRHGVDAPPIVAIMYGFGLFLKARAAYAQAEPLFRRALEIDEMHFGPDHPDVARDLNNLAELLRETNRLAEAESLYRRALAIDEKSLGPNHPSVATSLNNLAALYNDQGEYAKAEPLYQLALAIWEKALGPEHPKVAISLNNLASLYDNQGQYAKAESLYQRALAIQEKVLGPEHLDTAQSMNNLALLYDKQGQYALAQPLYEQAFAVRERALGPEHPSVATSLNNLAALYEAEGQYAKAKPLYERALAIQERTLGPEHPDVARSLNNLAQLYRAQGQYAPAEPLYRRALAIWEMALGPDHPNVATCLNNLALFYVHQGEYEKAQALYLRALSIDEASLGPEHPNVARELKNLALLLRATNRLAEAEPRIRRGLAIDEQSFGSEHPEVASSLNILAGLLQATNRLAEAESLYQRALSILLRCMVSTGREHPHLRATLENYRGLLKEMGYSPTEIRVRVDDIKNRVE